LLIALSLVIIVILVYIKTKTIDLFDSNFDYLQSIVNKYIAKATVTLNKSLSGNMFTSDSGLLTGNSYSLAVSVGAKNNYYVFAYRNGVRSSFPSTQVLDWNGILELWPITQCEFHGGITHANFTSLTARNLYTNQSMVISSNDWVNNTFGDTQIPQLGLNTYLSNH
jgi:hypothetical protein